MRMLIVNSRAFTTKSQIWAYNANNANNANVDADTIFLVIVMEFPGFPGLSRDQQMESESETWNDLFAIRIRISIRIRIRIRISSPDFHQIPLCIMLLLIFEGMTI